MCLLYGFGGGGGVDCRFYDKYTRETREAFEQRSEV